MSLWQRLFGPQQAAANSAAQTALNAQAQGTPVLPALQTINSSAEAVIVDPQNLLAALIAAIPPNRLEQIPFDLILSGYIKTTSTTNLTVKIYSGTSTTVGSDTALATSGAIAQNSATAPFEAHLHMIYDSVSGKLNGYFEFVLNNTVVAKTALSNVVTGISNLANPVLSFLASVTSSGADSTHLTTVNVQTFSVG